MGDVIGGSGHMQLVGETGGGTGGPLFWVLFAIAAVGALVYIGRKLIYMHRKLGRRS
jgi:hypothetical protein